MSWTDNVFSNEFSEDGTPVPQRKRVDFVGATVEDVPAEDLTRITITGGGGSDLSDSPARSVAEDSAAGTSAQASRADHVHAHGDLTGGSLHAVAVASVAGVGGSAGFASPIDKERTDQVPQMLLDIAALPSTYAPIVHTHAHSSLTGLTTGDPHTQYVLRTDGTVEATASKWVIRDGSGAGTFAGLVSPSLTHATSDLSITASGSGKAAIINGVGGVYLRHNGNNVAATTASSFLLYRSLQFDGAFNPSIGMPAAGSGTGKTITVAAQSVTTGTGGDVVLTGGAGTTAPGSVIATGKGIKLQVYDATTPATVRTPFEITREASGVGTADAVQIDASINAAGETIQLSAQDYLGVIVNGSVELNVTTDQISLSAPKISINGTAVCNVSTATAGQIRTLDGEILNAKGSTGSEACLVSYDKTLTSAVFGGDGAGTRPAVTSVLVGSTSAQLAVSGTAKLEARADQIKANTQLANGVNAVAASTATTTIDCSKGNVHKVTVTAATTIELTNTKAGAQYRIFFELSGSTSYTVTLGSATFDDTYDRDLPAGPSLTLDLTSSLKHAVVICEPHADTGKAFVTQMWTKP